MYEVRDVNTNVGLYSPSKRSKLQDAGFSSRCRQPKSIDSPASRCYKEPFVKASKSCCAHSVGVVVARIARVVFVVACPRHRNSETQHEGEESMGSHSHSDRRGFLKRGGALVSFVMGAVRPVRGQTPAPEALPKDNLA